MRQGFTSFGGALVLTVALRCAVATTWNGMSRLGVVRMPGLVVADSTLLVAFAQQRRVEGPETAEAIRLAARRRRRSIGMTLLATVLGLAPRAGKLGAGAERDAPLVVRRWGVCWGRDRRRGPALLRVAEPTVAALAFRRREEFK